MSEKQKIYQKPSIEVIDIQWSECIANSPIEQRGKVTLTIDSSNENSSFYWVGGSNTGWDQTKF